MAIDPTNPSTLYAAAGYDHGCLDWGCKILKSTDGGGGWTKASYGLQTFMVSLSAIVIDPLNSSTVYAAGGMGVFKSTDGGMSWRRCGTTMGSRGVNYLVIDSSNPSTLYAATYSGVFITRDGAATWSRLGGAPPSWVTDLEVDLVHPSTLYVGFYSCGVWKWRPASDAP